MPEALKTLLVLVLFTVLLASRAYAEDEGGGAIDAAKEATEGPGEAPQPIVPQDDTTGANDSGKGDATSLKWDVEGYLSEELRYRNAGGSDDLDSYTQIFSDITYHGSREWKTRINCQLVADMLGKVDETDPLRDVWDGYSGDAQFRLFEAYAETDGLYDLLDFRGGRQFIDEGTYLHFDGARLDVDLDKVLHDFTASLFGGVPVKFNWPSREDSWLVGFVVRGKVAERTRVRFEYYHVSEFFPGINDPIVDPLLQPASYPAQHLDDDLFGFSVWHRFADTLRAYVRFSLLNGEANELQGNLRWFTEDGKWAVVVDVYALFERLLNVTNDLTPYVPMLGTYEPFFRISGRVTYRIGEEWIFQGGYSHRTLDSSDEGVFNHEYDHFYVAVTRLGLIDDRLDLTVTGNGYTSSLNDVVNVNGNLDFRLSKKVTISGAVDYALYKYDFFQNTEREDVWTYVLRGRWQVRPKIRVDGEFSVDDDRFYTYYTVLFKVTVRF